MSNGRADVAREKIVGHTCHVGVISVQPLDVDRKDNVGIDLMQKIDQETWPPSSAEPQNLMRCVSLARVRTTLTQSSNSLSSCKGFHIAFVNTEFNHRRMVNSREGPGFLNSEFESCINVALTRARETRHMRFCGLADDGGHVS
ncbi:hypothetical protein CRG98_022438 [Punica granatum]|uniref:Uncharacterized protein n=1 Tax=Punica granatum TaxID=22663 RepID=A0A2I0JLJ7_PUNGR|nr:hypothetical protein CRG98_022438 [Punica granatum]